MRGIELVGTVDLTCRSLSGYANSGGVVAIGRGVLLLTRSFVEVPYALIVAVPNPIFIRLIASHRGIAVEQIDRGIDRMREGWNLNPIAHCPRTWVVATPLEGKSVCASRIRGEDDVVTVR